MGFFINNYLFKYSSFSCLKNNHIFVQMKWLNIVAKHHKEYVKLIESFGEYFYAEDIVQEAYIKMSKYCNPSNIIVNDEVNRGYVYFVLRNLYLDFKKQKEKNPKVSIDELTFFLTEEDEQEKHEAYLKLLHNINNEIDTWHWYDKMLFNVYKDKNKSIREMAKETRISTKSIFQTLKHCKERIKENVKEDYQDFKNEDYELIK